jgi:hypothetical protein
LGKRAQVNGYTYELSEGVEVEENEDEPGT